MPAVHPAGLARLPVRRTVDGISLDDPCLVGDTPEIRPCSWLQSLRGVRHCRVQDDRVPGAEVERHGLLIEELATPSAPRRVHARQCTVPYMPPGLNKKRAARLDLVDAREEDVNEGATSVSSKFAHRTSVLCAVEVVPVARMLPSNLRDAIAGDPHAPDAQHGPNGLADRTIVEEVAVEVPTRPHVVILALPVARVGAIETPSVVHTEHVRDDGLGHELVHDDKPIAQEVLGQPAARLNGAMATSLSPNSLVQRSRCWRLAPKLLWQRLWKLKPC
mmetsp:Transcript_107028/g.284786  ORF Transcript_107028/g.284786 Transcript_107028/m.284786 type:complete len:276 (+) Transcript_107028:376-1203(+)